MKKINLLKTIMASSLLLLASCGNDNNSQSSSNNSTSENTSTTQKVKVGVGYDVSFTYTDESSSAQISVATAFVAFDSTTNKVAANRMDVVQFNLVANEAKDGTTLKEGTALRDDGYVKTKIELGSDYGMFGSYGSSLAEFDVQLESYASWTVGKTVSEIENGANDEALKASCTVGTAQFSKAISNAYTNVSNIEYSNVETNKAGVALNTYLSNSKEVVVDVAGALVNADNKVVASSVDSIVVALNVADTGAISVNTSEKYHKGSTETEIKYLSKKTLKDDYGMKAYAGSAKEWYEQIASLEQTSVNKTAAEIGNLVKDDGSENPNIISGATINVTSYVSALKRATEYAKLMPIGPQHTK